jgi:tetratricopeptide (TPR) repeat protein
MGCHAMAGLEGISPCAKELATAVSQEPFQKVYWPAIMDKLTDAKNQGLPFFRQGMTQYYGLDYEEAMRNFKEAKKDPTLAAMASWGIALAAGPNINLDMTDACHCLAKREIKRAACLAGVDANIDLCPADKNQQEDCKPGAPTTRLEKDLIEALKQRYNYKLPVEAKKHAEDYKNAMAGILKQHSDDKNVSTLYAESMMNLHPWDLYENNGQPKEWTPRIVDVLKTATGDSQEAIGGNHYYIHAIEGSAALRKETPVQQAAMRSADLLQTQVRQSGHLVHMSSHIYLLLGEYQKSLDANLKAVDNDVMNDKGITHYGYGEACSGPYAQYIKNPGCPQLYYGHYVSHNYFFGSVSATFLGQSKDAIALACATQAHVQRFVAYEPGLQRYLAAPLMTQVVNRNWGAICDETNCKEETTPPPPNFENCYSQGHEDSGCRILRTIWYWARGMARVAYAKTADGDLNAMKKEMDKIPPCSKDTRTVYNTFGNNCALDVLKIGHWILYARIHWVDGEKDRLHQTFLGLKNAVDQEDSLLYDEPPQWFTPAREAFGGFYLQAAKEFDQRRIEYYTEALEIFEKALFFHPASGRALYGKMRALQGLGRTDDAQKAEQAFHKAWLTADYTMTDAGLWPDKNISEPSKEISEPSICACKVPAWPPPVGTEDPSSKKLADGLRRCSK